MKKIALLLIIVLSITSCKQKTIEEKFEDAIGNCNISRVRNLLSKNIEIDKEIIMGETALSYVCGIYKDNSYEIAELLIKKGANVNSTILNNEIDRKKFVFAKAERLPILTQCTSLEKAQLLVSNGAEVDLDCGSGITPLMYFVESSGIYQQKSDESWYKTYLEIIKLLLENGADVNHKLENGVTPLLIALQYQNREVVDLLLQYGAEIHEDYVHLVLNPFRNTIFEDFGDKADYNFSELTSICNAGYVDLLKKYLENHKVNLFSHSGDGYDYFFCAVQSNNPEIIEYLLPYYGNINSKRYTIIDLDNKPTYGYTLYGVAHKFGCEKVEEVLLAHGADGFTHY